MVTRLIRTLLIGVGGSLLVSSAVNIAGAVQLIEPTDETVLGLTRTEVILTFGVSALVGAAMVYGGMCRWHRAPPK